MDQGWYIVFCLALRCTALCTVGTRIWLDKGESGRVVVLVVVVVVEMVDTVADTLRRLQM